jgi:type VII secretion-associated serine protease mycosin
VVSTTLDDTGRPVTVARTATDREAATRLVRDGQSARRAVAVELDHVVTAAGDTYRDQQWDLDAARVPGAWPVSTGAGVTVAVIDTGVAADHPDLAGQILPGADFIAGTEGPSTDPNGHGTHVAGIIAAATGNGQGIAGIAPDARILPVRVLGANGSGYLSDTANGIVYAADHGADVINLSLSSTGEEAAVTNAISYARGKGVVVVAAAGNMRGSGSPVSYPAADPGVIAVAATDSSDAIASYSNAGGYVDVAAPGSAILSTYPTGYRAMNGTSMASPHVAALAALIRAADHALTPDQVEQAIESSAVDLGAPGRDDDYGHGRIDATAALASLAPASTTAPPASEPTTTEPTTVAPTTAALTPPAGEPTPSAEPTPSEQPTTEPVPTREPTTEPVPAREPTTEAAPSREPTTEPTPSVEPTPDRIVGIRAVRTGPGRLLIALDGVDGQTVELQQETESGWTSVLAYPATRVARLSGLTRGGTYRVVVPTSTRYAGAVKGPLRL